MNRIALSLVLLTQSMPPAGQHPAPVTIEVLRDVEVRTSERLPDGTSRQVRGVLYGTTAFRLRKGQRLEMIEAKPEGGCRVRIGKQEYAWASCPWLPGFRDHQGDIFKVIAHATDKTPS